MCLQESCKTVRRWQRSILHAMGDHCVGDWSLYSTYQGRSLRWRLVSRFYLSGEITALEIGLSILRIRGDHCVGDWKMILTIFVRSRE